MGTRLGEFWSVCVLTSVFVGRCIDSDMPYTCIQSHTHIPANTYTLP